MRRAGGGRRVTMLIHSGGEIMGVVYDGMLAPPADGLLDRVIDSERGAESWLTFCGPGLPTRPVT